MSDFSTILTDTFFILVIIWLIVLIFSVVSLLNRKDLLTPVKVFWIAIIFFAPVVGLLIYILKGPKRSRDAVIRR